MLLITINSPFSSYLHQADKTRKTTFPILKTFPRKYSHAYEYLFFRLRGFPSSKPIKDRNFPIHGDEFWFTRCTQLWPYRQYIFKRMLIYQSTEKLVKLSTNRQKVVYPELPYTYSQRKITSFHFLEGKYIFFNYVITSLSFSIKDYFPCKFNTIGACIKITLSGVFEAV